jgi:hypothetical protein
VTLSVIIQSALVQTLIARMATDYLTKELNTNVQIDKIKISSLKEVCLRNVFVEDLHQDTLLFAGKLSVNLNWFSVRSEILYFREINVDSAIFRLKTYEGSKTTNLSFVLNYFNAKASGEMGIIHDSMDVAAPKPWDIQINELVVHHSEFVYQNQNRPKTEGQMDYSDMKVTGIDLDLENFSMKADTMFAKVNHLSANEKCGFTLDSLSGDIKFSSRILQVKDFQVLTPMNHLKLDLEFSYKSLTAFRNFNRDIKIKAHIKPSIVNLTEVGYFAKTMFPMDNRMKISGDVRGTVDNFKARNFKFAYGKTTQFRGNITMSGLPEVRETFTHLSIHNFITSATDVESFRLPTEKVFIPLPKVIQNFGKTRIKGKFTGFYNDFVANANFRTDIGNVNTDLVLKVNSSNTIAYTGKIKMLNLDAGKLLNVEDNLGLLTFKATVDGSGLNKNNARITINGLIDSINVYGNLYRQITLSGNLAEKKFSGDFQVNDKKAQIDFNGSIDFNNSVPAYNFTAEIDNAYLQQLNLVERTPSMCLSTSMNIDFRGDDIDNIQGIIKLNNTKYSEKEKSYFMKDFTLSITRDSTEYAFISLYSDIVDAMVEGKFKLAEIPFRVENLFNTYLDTLFAETVPDSSLLFDQDFIFEVTLKNTKAISELFVPQLLVMPNTVFTGGFNTHINNLFVDGRSPKIIFKGSKLKNWNFDFYFHENEIRMNTGCERLVFSDTLGIDSLKFIAAARNDSVFYSLGWDNEGVSPTNKGDIRGFVNFDNRHKYQLKLQRADITIANSLWQVSKDNYLLVDTGFIHFNDFGFRNREQSIHLNGVISPNPLDSMQVAFEQFDLANLDIVLKRIRMDMGGVINGNFTLMDYYGQPNYLSDLTISDFYFNREKLGDAFLTTIWDPQQKAFDILAQIIYTGNVGKRKTLDISGTYYPQSKTRNFDIDVNLENYKLLTLQPFVKDFASDIKGLASGKLKLTGTTEKPEILGNINLVHSSMKINYLNVNYYFAGQVNFTDNSIYFNDIIVYDSLNNEAVCTGKFTHDYFKDIKMDLNVKTDKIVGLNTGRADNDIFYGKAVAGGNVHIFGPLDNLAFDIAVKSEKGTDIKIPISSATEIAENDFITFEQPEIDSAFMEEPIEIEEKNVGVALKLELNLTNDAEIQMFLPYSMGNIRGKGHGQILMDVTPEGDFTMNGEYLLDRGSFFLTLQNIINRDFSIRRGSKVSWSGDPYNAEISMKAVYKVKTSLGDYDPTGSGEKRVTVDCVIGLTNNLYNPEIKFSIEFPDMRDSDKQFVYSRLDTTDQALMSQQMLSLLVMNSFANSSESTGAVSFNTYSLLTNQLNNWLSGISNDFDVGINYQPGDEISQQEVEVALSTQLFDDRVIIDGNVGMISQDRANNTNEIVGEVTVEVMLTPDGRWRGKAFNKSNHDYLYRNYSPYTQGLGIFFTKEFSSFRDLFTSRKKKMEKKEKEELSIQE